MVSERNSVVGENRILMLNTNRLEDLLYKAKREGRR